MKYSRVRRQSNKQIKITNLFPVFPVAFFIKPMIYFITSPRLIHDVAETISVEVHAKYNDYIKQGLHGFHKGISCFSPVVNIMRHPLWGRNQVRCHFLGKGYKDTKFNEMKHLFRTRYCQEWHYSLGLYFYSRKCSELRSTCWRSRIQSGSSVLRYTSDFLGSLWYIFFSFSLYTLLVRRIDTCKPLAEYCYRCSWLNRILSV